MTRSRLVLIAACSFSAFASAVACVGSDDNDGGDDSSTDSGSGSDVTVANDSGPPQEAGPADSGPFCNVTPCAVAVGAGGLHSCAILSDGTIRCWGSNTYGELGSGTPIDGGTFTPIANPTPVAVPGISTATKVAGGGYYGTDIGWTCALLANKTVDCWGYNGFGDLARGDASIPSDTTPESTLLTSAVDISASLYATCAVLSSGDVACWGINAGGQIAFPVNGNIYPSTTIVPAGGTKFVRVSVGAVNVCAITDDAHVWCWGAPTDGANGHLTDAGAQDFLPAAVGGLDSVVDIAVGLEGACAVKTDGSVACWGANIGGDLGRGNPDGGPAYDVAPATVTTPVTKKFVAVASHLEGYCAIADDGSVWCWGLTALGLSGSGTADAGDVYPVSFFEATQVPGLTDVTQLASVSYGTHTCALIRGGAVKCWGYDLYSQLGSAPPDGGDPFSIAPLTVNF